MLGNSWGSRDQNIVIIIIIIININTDIIITIIIINKFVTNVIVVVSFASHCEQSLRLRMLFDVCLWKWKNSVFSYHLKIFAHKNDHEGAGVLDIVDDDEITVRRVHPIS